MKHIYFFLFSCLITANVFSSNEENNKDSLIADFDYLIQLLEETHPDPYTNYGGKVFFHKDIYTLKEELIEQNLTTEEFAIKLNTFLSKLKDGHTYIHTPTKEQQYSNYLPIRVRTLPNDLILSCISQKHQELLGSKILNINGSPLDSVLEKVKTLVTCENKYDAYCSLGDICSINFLKTIFPEITDSLRLLIETPAGDKQIFSLSLSDKEAISCLPNWDKSPKNYIGYNFIDDNKQIMLFKVRSITARENFEYTLQNNWENAYNDLQDFYKYNLRKEMPTDTLQALANVPSFSETFLGMLKEMKKQHSKALIIDLRENGGGWTPITLPTLYMLYGDKYFQKDMDIHFYRKISKLYLQKINTSLDDLNHSYESNYQLGDYTFEEENDNYDIITDSIRQLFINNFMSNIKSELIKQKGQPIYTPQQIYVVTDPYTFSAAFHYAFYLWKMGATLVGVPSSQAPNTFMEVTPFELPYTGLKGSISNTAQYFLPANDKRANVFLPDIMFNYKDYKKYQFNFDAEIMLLRDKILEQKD